MAAPVVPTMLAISVPNASSTVLTSGVPRRLPVTRMPPATTYSANSSTMKLRYSPSAAWTKDAIAAGRPYSKAIGSTVAAPQASASLP